MLEQANGLMSHLRMNRALVRIDAYYYAHDVQNITACVRQASIRGLAQRILAGEKI
jgi:hypothetical protein